MPRVCAGAQPLRRCDYVATAESRPVQVPASKTASEPITRVTTVAAQARLVEPSGERRRQRLNSCHEFTARVDNQAKAKLD